MKQAFVFWLMKPAAELAAVGILVAGLYTAIYLIVFALTLAQWVFKGAQHGYGVRRFVA